MSDLRRRQFDAFLATSVIHDGQHPLLTSRVVHSGATATVCLCGELDLASAPAVEREVQSLFALPIDAVTLDMSSVTFMDSSGLNALNRLRRAAEDHGVKFTLGPMAARVREVLELTDMMGIFVIEPTEPSAAWRDGFD